MNFQYVFFLGRQPELSATEAWYATQSYKPHVLESTKRLLVIETEQEIPTALFSRLGGSDRVGRVLQKLPSLPTAKDILDAFSPTTHKFAFGLSTLGAQRYDKHFLFSIKKEAKERGFKLRFTESNNSREQQLSSAQVLFNGLYREPNAEITVVPFGKNYLIVRTIWVQDIQAYERRDTGRPVRDARVGMLPPKLAQIMLTLAASRTKDGTPTFYDPFCGLGTILQEGVLDGYTMIGSDNTPAMVEASKKNVAALDSTSPLEIFEHDASLPFPDHLKGKVSGIVTEPYLGKPLTAPLSAPEGEAYIQDLLPLYRAFFRNTADILPSGAPLLFIIPRMRGTHNDWISFPASFIDEIASFGYHLEHLVPPELEPFLAGIDPTALWYNRPDAMVGRTLRLWTRI